jgi:CBS domain-containing protein
MDKPISSLMTFPVRSVGMDDKVADIESLMTRQDLSWVPVVEPGGAAVGVVTRSDLLQFHARRRDPAEVAAWLICSYKPISVEATATVGEVANLMLQRKLHHVVVTRNGSMVGVVSSLDFVRLATPGGRDDAPAPSAA